MVTRCKMKCMMKTELPGDVDLVFTAVTEGSSENKEFFKYTPNGKLEVSVVNKTVAEQFVPGKYCFVIIGCDANKIIFAEQLGVGLSDDYFLQHIF